MGKKITKKYHKPHKLRHVFKDKKGHTLEKVTTRPNQYTGLKVRPYYYCPQCDRFFKQKLEKVILLT